MTAVTKRYAAPAKRKNAAKPRSASVGAGASMPAGARSKPADLRVETVRSKPRRNRAVAREDFKTSMLNIRVKDELKERATATLERVGISLPEAVRVFLGRIVRDQAFPFPLHVPNAETAAALRDSMASDHKRYSDVEEMFDDLEKGGVS